MKRILYILAFGLLGLLFATLVHSVVELIALELIFSDEVNADSWWWREWETIHAIGAAGLWAGGLLAGLFAGWRWWDQYGSRPGAFGWRR
jgi:hypothetical protein